MVPRGSDRTPGTGGAGRSGTGGAGRPGTGGAGRSATVCSMEPFVSVDWLREHRDEVVLADLRFYLDGRPGRPAYEAGHIPGAVYVELEEALSEPHQDDLRGRHPLASPQRFAAQLGALGIGDADVVVAYDDCGGVIAARLVWLLRITGGQAALLDGGLGAWPERELERQTPPARPPAQFTARPWPRERFAAIDELGQTTDVMIDARDSSRFHGGPDPVDPRSGHIPGARNVPTREHIEADGLIGQPERLRERFAAAGILAGTPVISYCGSGVSACHNLLALERAGLGPGRLYVGSWSEWSRDPRRPIATD